MRPLFCVFLDALGCLFEFCFDALYIDRNAFHLKFFTSSFGARRNNPQENIDWNPRSKNHCEQYKSNPNKDDVNIEVSRYPTGYAAKNCGICIAKKTLI